MFRFYRRSLRSLFKIVHFSFAKKKNSKKKNPSERYKQKKRDGTLHGLEQIYSFPQLLQSDPKLTSGMVQKLLSNLHDKQGHL